jgi:hypothetical protein
MPLTGLTVHETPHNMDGMVLHARGGSEYVRAFISRRVMAIWVEPVKPLGRQKRLGTQNNSLGKLNLAAIGRIASCGYNRGLAFNRQPPSISYTPGIT